MICAFVVSICKKRLFVKLLLDPQWKNSLPDDCRICIYTINYFPPSHLSYFDRMQSIGLVPSHTFQVAD